MPKRNRARLSRAPFLLILGAWLVNQEYILLEVPILDDCGNPTGKTKVIYLPRNKAPRID